MTKKTPDKKANLRRTHKKPRLTQLIFIFFAIIISIIFIFFSTYTPKKIKPDPKQSSSASTSGPSFRKDGSLSIIKAGDPSPVTLDIEIADEEAERVRGLMDRLILPDNAGMFFIFPHDEPRSFWMKNTYIPLDIIYINSGMEIVSIQKYTQPKTTYSIPSEKPAKYVLEVNAGFSEKHGISPGDQIEFFD